MATVATGPSVGSAGEDRGTLDEVTYHEFDYGATRGAIAGATGEGRGSGRAGPGYLRCQATLDGVSASNGSSETFTVPIRREAGTYEIRFDWRLEGTRTDGANMVARANLWRGPEETRERPVQTLLLSSATRGDPSFSGSGTAIFEAELHPDVETVVSMELALFTSGRVSGTESADFEMWVPRPNDCDEDDRDPNEESPDDEDCDLPPRVSVRPA